MPQGFRSCGKTLRGTMMARMFRLTLGQEYTLHGRHLGPGEVVVNATEGRMLYAAVMRVEGREPDVEEVGSELVPDDVDLDEIFGPDEPGAANAASGFNATMDEVFGTDPITGTDQVDPGASSALPNADAHTVSEPGPPAETMPADAPPAAPRKEGPKKDDEKKDDEKKESK